jgi:hypothetical protein
MAKVIHFSEVNLKPSTPQSYPDWPIVSLHHTSYQPSNSYPQTKTKNRVQASAHLQSCKIIA